MSVTAISAQAFFWPAATTGTASASTNFSQASNAKAGTSNSSSQPSSTDTNTSTAQTPAEKARQTREVAKLQTVDQSVRSHEAAHLAAAGALATGGAQFTYETGPDGARYAVAGEVNITVSEGRTPEETLQRAEQVRRAALAPADPSAQDLAVAAMASEMASKARQEIASAQVSAYSDQGAKNGTHVDTNA